MRSKIADTQQFHAKLQQSITAEHTHRRSAARSRNPDPMTPLDVNVIAVGEAAAELRGQISTRSYRELGQEIFELRSNVVK